MKILVFVKQVPDTSDAKIDPKTGNLKREGMESLMNPLDANAIEAALRLKEACGGTITAVSMGPDQADDVLKKALAMGCDESVLLSDRAFGRADTLATGYTLAMAAKKIGGYDLLIFGRNSTDGETAQTGPIVAAFLDIPQITLAESLDVDGDWVVATRTTEDGTEKVKAKMPALVTVCGNINEPRYATPIGIMKALKKPRAKWNCAQLGADPAQCGLAGSPSVTKTLFEPKHEKVDTVYFTGDENEMAKQFVDMLEAKHLI